MSSVAQNYDWNTAYQTISHYTSSLYYQSITWVQSQLSSIYSKLPTIQTVFKQYAQSLWDTSKTFLWKHKVFVIGAAIVAVAWWISRYIRNKIPQYPVVKMESTLDVAKLQIEIPKELQAPINVTLTYCIDTSGSMKESGRIDAVKTALTLVLKNAQTVVNESDGAKMRMTIVGFDSASRVILPITEVVKNGSVQTALNTVTSLTCDGLTNILKGLDQAVQQLTVMAKADQEASHTVILLTDGDSSVDKKQLESIHNRLAVVSANLFAIGIGKDHEQQTLKQIAGKGTYIDTTQNNPTIEDAIATIYKQARSSFQQLSLSTEQLDAGTWSVEGKSSVLKEKRSVCDLETLPAGETRKAYIKIHREKISSDLDLSTVKFTLAFTDPKGRKGTLSLPWNPTPFIRPQILKGAK